jgi:uncharacterized protein (TIGR02284 family)
MQNLNEKTIDAIQDLIVINNDRFEGYKTAASETKDTDLKMMFTEFSEQSNRFARELEQLLPADAKSPKDSTLLSGKLYRVWMDIKSAITARDRKAILSSCEFGEDVALKAYREVVDKQTDLAAEVSTLLRQQKDKIQEGHDKVKRLRDLQKQD